MLTKSNIYKDENCDFIMKRIEITEEKLFFWEKVFQIMIFSFMLFFGLAFVVPELYFNYPIFLYSWILLFWVMIISEVIFTFGMAYYAFKLKRYGWVFVNIFLGTVFSIMFFFKILKKQFN